MSTCIALHCSFSMGTMRICALHPTRSLRPPSAEVPLKISTLLQNLIWERLFLFHWWKKGKQYCLVFVLSLQYVGFWSIFKRSAKGNRIHQTQGTENHLPMTFVHEQEK